MCFKVYSRVDVTLKFSFEVFDVTPTSFSFLVQASLSLWLKAAVLSWQDAVHPPSCPFCISFFTVGQIQVVWKALCVLLLTLVDFTQAPICMLLIYKSHFVLFWFLYPLYCCCVGGNVDSKSSFSNCNRINLCFFESPISACESLKKLDKVRFLAVMILKKSLRS